MKIASYRRNGEAGYGAVLAEGIAPLAPLLPGAPATLRAALERLAIAEIVSASASARARFPLADVVLDPVVPHPDKTICIGINYRSHAQETGRDVVDNPSLFTRLDRTLLGNGAPMIRPSNSTSFDFEGELAIVIGTGGRLIAAEKALDHVAGYTCFNDGSVRDFQKHSVTAGKNFDATAPVGPWMVTRDEIPDPTRLELTTRLNGQVVQQSGTDKLIHSVQKLIAYCSSFTTLMPGDVIATGTPEGVGARRTPPLWMKPGDVIEVEISGIGILRNPVVAEA